MTEEERREAQIFLPPDQQAGVWANWAQVHHSDHEFTIDFVRMEYAATPLTGLVVSRVSVSPLFVTQLIDALQENWRKYAEKAMPRELRDHDDTDTDD
jgi:Protein of unknown function (DUF3467)